MDLRSQRLRFRNAKVRNEPDSRGEARGNGADRLQQPRPEKYLCGLRPFLNWLIGLRGSPEAIARGVAVGMVVAFTPTIGIQTVLALGLATLLGANRPVSIVPTWLTNPLTIPPVYGFTYMLGNLVWPGPDLERVSGAIRDAARELEGLDFLAFREQLGVFFGLGLDVFVALWIGGLLLGSFAAAILYPLTLRAVVHLRERRERGKRRRHRMRRRRP